MYKLAKKLKGTTGYKGKVLTDENINSFDERLLKIWEKAGIIKKVNTKNDKK